MGGTRVEIDSRFQQKKKRAKRCCADDDRISTLTDDVLCVILSFLPLKEAACTSVLSSRWINLWKHSSSLNTNDWISKFPDDILVAILCLLPLKKALCTSVLSSRWINLWKHTSSLDFHDDRALDRFSEQTESLEVDREEFVKRVNRIVQSHKSPTLKEFRVCFNLSKASEKAITQWLEYAFARQVQRLELDFSEHIDGLHYPTLSYAFPEDFLTQRSSLDFKFLKALSLKCVNVSSEAVEFFLRNCAQLERLIIHGTDKISNLEVCGSSLMLKHLEIDCAYGLKFLKISAPKLTSLNVKILKGLLLENVPLLVDVSVIVLDYGNTVEELLRALSCCLSQLEILSLTVIGEKGVSELSKISELPKLKKLDIEYCPKVYASLIGLTTLIRAAPYLKEFGLKVIWPQHVLESSRSNREVMDGLMLPHQQLEVVKFYGYYGCASTVELVRHLLERCAVLDTIIVDPRDQLRPLFSRAPLSPDELEMEQMSRNSAKQQLTAEVPKHIKLVIL